MSRNPRQIPMFVVGSTMLLFASACSDSAFGPEATARTSSATTGTGLVISQVYGGGGNSGATFTHDFVELFNNTGTTASLSGYSLQYASAAGTFQAGNVITLPATASMLPGTYYLVELGSGGSVGIALPMPDDPVVSTINMAATAGKVALVQGTSPVAAETDTAVVDFVGYGTTANAFEGTGPAPGPSNNAESSLRKLAGCTFSNNNAADFATGTVNARNSSSPVVTCAGGGSDAGTDAVAPADGGGGTDASANDAAAEAAVEAGQDAAVTDAGAEAAVDASVESGSDASVGNTQGLVISQIYGGGGNASATYTADFVELFNRGSAPVSLSDLSLQYASATGNFEAPSVAPLPSVSIDPGHYYLVALGSGGANGVALPTPDLTNINLNAGSSSGKLALAIGTTALGCGGDGGPCSTSTLVDFVGYGTTASEFEGSGPATGPSANTLAVLRREAGCIDTNDNLADFENPALAVTPRNSATAANKCSVLIFPSDGGLMDGGGTTTDAGLDSAADGAEEFDSGFPVPDASETDASTFTDASTSTDATTASDAHSSGGADSGANGPAPSSEQSGCGVAAGSPYSSGLPSGVLVGGAAIALARLRRRRSRLQVA